MKLKLSLRFKLSVAFVMVALFIFLVIYLLANVVLEKQFKNYTINKIEKTITDIVSHIADQYKESESIWNHQYIENTGINALSEGLIIRVVDKDNDVIWDARIHNNGMCMSMIQNMSENMQAHNPNFKGGYQERTYPIVSQGKTKGQIFVGYYGPYFYSDLDIKYLATLNNLLLWAALISLLACLAFGTYMARRLTSPMAHVVKTAREIAKGHYNDRIDEKSNTKEIIALTDSVNSLAMTLGKQEVLRKRQTADVAHELRTPLASLQGYVEAFIDGIWEPDQKRLKGFYEELQRLSKLVGELERLSIYEGDNLALEIEQFDITSLIKGVAANFAVQFKNRNISFNLKGEKPVIKADKDKISQVFINLLSNSMKYTPDGGAIEINIKGVNDAVKIDLHDTGTGIPSEDLPYIFERFYRADKSRNRATGGAGIGLTIVKSIVEAHKGTITVESELNKGCTFAVTIPKS